MKEQTEKMRANLDNAYNADPVRAAEVAREFVGPFSLLAGRQIVDARGMRVAAGAESDHVPEQRRDTVGGAADKDSAAHWIAYTLTRGARHPLESAALWLWDRRDAGGLTAAELETFRRVATNLTKLARRFPE